MKKEQESEQEQKVESEEEKNPILSESGYCGYAFLHPIDERSKDSESEDESEDSEEEAELEQLAKAYEVYQEQHKDLPKSLHEFIEELKQIEIEE